MPIQTPTITQSGGILTTATSAITYLWYLNSVPITTATAQTHTASVDGFYSLEVTNALGCKAFSNTQYVTTVGIEDYALLNGISLSPNPAKDILNINNNNSDAKLISYSILNSLGQAVKKGTLEISNFKTENITISNLSIGLYALKLTTGEKSKTISFVKE